MMEIKMKEDDEEMVLPDGNLAASFLFSMQSCLFPLVCARQQYDLPVRVRLCQKRVKCLSCIVVSGGCKDADECCVNLGGEWWPV